VAGRFDGSPFEAFWAASLRLIPAAVLGVESAMFLDGYGLSEYVGTNLGLCLGWGFLRDACPDRCSVTLLYHHYTLGLIITTNSD
jgi:hypothetical protein